MARRPNVVIKPWVLPLIIIALVLPGTIGFIVAGPGLGLAIGALSVASLIAVAVRSGRGGPIEVASAADHHRRLLLVAIEPVDEPEEVESVRAAAQAGADDEPEVLVLAPALNTTLSHWASDIGRSRLDAQRKLVLTVGALAAARVEARGAVGDADPLQAVEDTLREFAADEVIVAAPANGAGEQGRELVAALRRRLDLPVYRLAETRASGVSG
jgi:hypothetical protein